MFSTRVMMQLSLQKFGNITATLSSSPCRIVIIVKGLAIACLLVLLLPGEDVPKKLY